MGEGAQVRHPANDAWSDSMKQGGWPQQDDGSTGNCSPEDSVTDDLAASVPGRPHGVGAGRSGD